MFKFFVFALALGVVNCTTLKFGFGFPSKTRGLTDDLADIVEILPTGDYLLLIAEYVSIDAEVQDILRYLQGPEWAALVQRVSSNPTWIEFKEYALAQGVNVDNIVQHFHDLINSVEVPDVGGSIGGIRDLLDKIKAITPFDELAALINEKIQTSEEFRNLFNVIAGEKSRNFVEQLLADEEVIRLGQVLRAMGVDVDLIKQTIFDFLGWTRYISQFVPIEYI